MPVADTDDVWQYYPVLDVGEGGVGGVEAHFAVSELGPWFWRRGSDVGVVQMGGGVEYEPRQGKSRD